MRKWKRIVSVLLTMVMVLGLSMTALADDDNPTNASPTNGSITIDNAVEGQTYKIYRVFDLEVDDVENPTAYKYTLNDSWSGLASYDTTIDGETVNASSFFTVSNTDGHIEWGEDADVASFAKLLDAYQEEKNVIEVDSKTADTDTVVFTGLELGYYFVQSGLGSLCSLDTAAPDVIIKEKNAAPSVDKEVEEDSSGDYGDSNTADIGDTVYFQTTINAKPGAENYVLHDTMTGGLTFDSTSVKVIVGEATLTADTDYSLVTSPNDGCTFEITFAESYLDSITTDTTITVTYSATVNDSAVIDGSGNTNTTHLQYGENSDISTVEKTTTTYVFSVDILKYTDGVDDAGNTTQIPLEGAEFVLYKTVGGTNYYAKVDENGKLTGWTTNQSETTTTLTSDTEGKISVEGLDADTYYLKETKAPEGYNLLDEPMIIVIDDSGIVTMNGAKVTTVEVENQSGSLLPSTGGIGTTIFYAVGGILVVGAGIVLITRKRMSHAEE